MNQYGLVLITKAGRFGVHNTIMIMLALGITLVFHLTDYSGDGILRFMF